MTNWVFDWHELIAGKLARSVLGGRGAGNGSLLLDFRIGVLASNLFLLFRRLILDERFQRAQVQTVRWQVYQVAGKIVRHAGALVLKVAEDCLASFRTLRERCWRLWCREGSP